MFNINLIRENPKLVKENLKKRKDQEKISWIDEIIKKDEEWRGLKKKVDNLRHKRNTLSQEINKLKKEGKTIKKILEEAKQIPKKIEELEKKADKIKEKINYYLYRIPNMMHESVPYGEDDSDNVEVRKWGKIRKIDFELKPHGELAEELGVADFTKSAEVSGTGFYYLKGPLALLNQALIRFAIDSLLKKSYTYIEPPLMLRKEPYSGIIDLKEFEDVMYKMEGEDLHLIGTSEHSVGVYYRNEILKEEELPKKYVAYSMCFRKEIGSHGVDTRGLFRTHQFNKVEQFIFCKPKDSWKYHEELQKNAEEIYQALEIPYRVVNICTGDLGIIAAKKYDIEGWMPRQNSYKELGSNSNCTDYQARRSNVRFIDSKGNKEYVHTLNNTAIATSRAMVSIIENNQQKDGSILIPKVLQPYMNKLKKIDKQKY